MTSASRAQEHPLPEYRPPAGGRVRLKLKPKSSTASGFVDGGWWPRSRDLLAELPALVAVLTVRLGRVERVSYRLSEWGPAGRRMIVDGAIVRLKGYRSQPAGTVDVIAATQRVTLLLVPAGTAPEDAHRALVAAGHRGNTDSIAELLTSPKVPDGMADAVQGWESDGGAPGVDQAVPPTPRRSTARRRVRAGRPS